MIRKESATDFVDEEFQDLGELYWAARTIKLGTLLSEEEFSLKDIRWHINSLKTSKEGLRICNPKSKDMKQMKSRLMKKLSREIKRWSDAIKLRCRK